MIRKITALILALTLIAAFPAGAEAGQMGEYVGEYAAEATLWFRRSDGTELTSVDRTLVVAEGKTPERCALEALLHPTGEDWISPVPQGTQLTRLERSGGIVTVDGDPTYTLLGPEAPEDRGKIEIYTPRRTAIIVEATPTPTPIIVYCNPGGQYYHSEDCAHVTKGETPQATLEQALRAGYRQCPECNAPSELEG